MFAPLMTSIDQLWAHVQVATVGVAGRAAAVVTTQQLIAGLKMLLSSLGAAVGTGISSRSIECFCKCWFTLVFAAIGHNPHKCIHISLCKHLACKPTKCCCVSECRPTPDCLQISIWWLHNRTLPCNSPARRVQSQLLMRTPNPVVSKSPRCMTSLWSSGLTRKLEHRRCELTRIDTCSLRMVWWFAGYCPWRPYSHKQCWHFECWKI